MATCEHIRCETLRTAVGDVHTFLVGIDNPAGTKTCEVCRKLEAFDALLESCRELLRWLEPEYGLDGEKLEPECVTSEGCDGVVYRARTVIARVNP